MFGRLARKLSSADDNMMRKSCIARFSKNVNDTTMGKDDRMKMPHHSQNCELWSNVEAYLEQM